MRRSLTLEFEIKSDFGYLPFLTRIFPSLKNSKASALTQILVEAFNNAVIHAHGFDKQKWVGLRLKFSPKKTTIEVSDQGRGFSLKRSLKKPKRLATSGRGLLLIRSYADKITVKKRGGRHIFQAVCRHE